MLLLFRPQYILNQFHLYRAANKFRCTFVICSLLLANSLSAQYSDLSEDIYDSESANDIEAYSMDGLLSGTYRSALGVDWRFNAIQANQQSVQARSRGSRSRFLPTLGVVAQVGYLETALEQDSSNPFAIDARQVNHDEVSGYRVVLQQTILNMVSINEHRQSANLLNRANMDVELAHQSLILRVSTAYLGTVNAGELLLAAESKEQSLQAQLKSIEQLYNEGLGRLSDLNQVRAERDAAVAERLIAANNLSQSFDLLSTLSGQDFQSIPSFAEQFQANLPEPQQVDEWVSGALENNLQLKAAAIDVEIASRNTRINKSRRLPALSLELNYSDQYRDQENGQFITEQLRADGWSGFINLVAPLYSGGLSRAVIDEAVYLQSASEITFEGLNRDIAQATRTQYLSLVASVSTLKARQAAVLSAQTGLESVQSGFEEGAESISNLLIAHQLYFEAKRDYSTAIVNYLQTALQLKALAGQLSENDLIEIDRHLDPQQPIQRDFADTGRLSRNIISRGATGQ